MMKDSKRSAGNSSGGLTRASWVSTSSISRAPARAVERARKAANTGQVLAAAGDFGLGDLVAARAREVALATPAGGTEVEVCVFDRGGRLVGHARP